MRKSPRPRFSGVLYTPPGVLGNPVTLPFSRRARAVGPGRTGVRKPVVSLVLADSIETGLKTYLDVTWGFLAGASYLMFHTSHKNVDPS